LYDSDLIITFLQDSNIYNNIFFHIYEINAGYDIHYTEKKTMISIYWWFRYDISKSLAVRKKKSWRKW